MRPWFGSPLYVSSAAKAFDGTGLLVDSSVRERLANFVRLFAAFVAENKSAASR
jgi:hypothetical protein